VARERFILAIDQGTTNTKALLLSHAGKIIAAASRPLAVSFPRDGWVEQDARELWQSTLDAVKSCLAQRDGIEIAAIGVSNQRESVVIWDKHTGEPVAPCVVWQCRRTEAACAELGARGFGKIVREKSGLSIDPLFSGSKIAWLLANTANGRARAESRELCAGTIDSWLLWNLTGGAIHATDTSNASRTQLLNLRSLEWDDELLRLFDVPRACLPEVRPSSGVFGVTVSAGPIAPGIPIASLIGDSHAALFGHGAFIPGIVKATYGTGSSVMTLTPVPVESKLGLSTTVAWRINKDACYALEGNITNTGGTIQWLGELLSLNNPAEGVAELANTASDSCGVYIVPAFAGLGAPHWDPHARGLITGLTRGTTAAHLSRAALESIAFQIRDVFTAMSCEAGVTEPVLHTDGGASRNDRLMQFQADILGCPVVRSSSVDLSARGAGWMAGLAVGFWASLAELESLPMEFERFTPSMPTGRRQQLLEGWSAALRRTTLSSSDLSMKERSYGAN
jgi:glycerol kinase